ncbi:SDR family NAD(P)-dependent oxidoreductase [Prauserella alba]|uniref:3-oxoacyl-ACP reductase FabG n=1 Tax=Prauserella alba TaxID=176898 RepID=A0ABP4G0D6_9PSEU|nr:SDR family NAD(P)-dependent oxidoreductase [Prauserella alba]MCP2182575.1 NAD(P)-dependent dehydrogenase, short-chain alcohol dehydrogenase family [Prauserella alba]
MTLAGKVALVSGGSRGIGAAIATRLAADGADVALTYTSAEQQSSEVVGRIEAHGRKALAIRADSTDADAVADSVHRTAETLGGVDILVNNAGVFPTATIDELTVAEIDRTLAIHVRAVLVATQAAARYLPDGGRVINIGSSLAGRAPGPGLSLYSASKSALDGLTRGLARDLGPRGISAVVVHPGSTDTDMNPADGPRAAAQKAGRALTEYAAPDDVAATVAHLAGEGGRFITGSGILVDGGASA